MRNREYRRYKKWVKFKRRIDIWTQKDTAFRVDKDWKQEIINGEKATWLRTTGMPCSCPMCSFSYKRPQKQYVQKDIFEQI